MKQTLKDYITQEQMSFVMEENGELWKGKFADLQMLPRALKWFLLYECGLGDLICKIFGHKYVDDSGAHPAESGRWGLYCPRCGHGEYGFW